jgi:formate dehydrogenase iron-sulfur subunit
MPTGEPTALEATIERVVGELKHKPGALLPILHAIQDSVGYIPPACVPVIADALNLSRAEVHGVVSFYHHFRDTPPGKHIVHLCRAEACQAMQQRALERHAQARLGIDFHQTTADGGITLEPIYCLGNCALSPAMMVDGHLYGRVTPQKFDAIIDSPGARASRGTIAFSERTPQAGTVKVYVPCDSGSVSMGADAVAAAISDLASAVSAGSQAPAANIAIVRNGSRGLYWLEPLVEVETPQGRIAYGPVQTSDVEGLMAAGFLSGSLSNDAHPLCLGPTEDIPYLKNQERLTCGRVGVIDPVSIADYIAHGGFQGLRRALTMSAADIVKEVTESGLRGRGGAAFPTGVKWRTVLDQPMAQKYIACNADEGDSGTFSDRMIMEGDPFVLIEGMIIAAIAVGAAEGYIYLRVEYPHAKDVLREAIAAAYAAGYLGPDVCGSGKRFDLDIRIGAAAYICGEETSMLESLEGKRGEIRVRPPLPAVEGLFGKPTVVNNVISLASVPIVLAKGAAYYRDYGMGRSRGTLPIQLAGNIKHGGLVEKAFGITLRELLYDYGGGSASGRPIRAVQVGGPLGAYIPASQFDTRIDYEAFTEIGALLGHGGIVVFDDQVDMAEMAQYAMEFCAHESCGKCTPCRIGSVRGVEIVEAIRGNRNTAANLALLDELCETLLHGSLCGLGGLTPYPVQSALRHFREDFGA